MADRARRILIDGRSGSGKTELARAILADWPQAQLVRMDDLYPGWNGLAEGAARVSTVLKTGSYRRWDWGTDAPDGTVRLDLDRPIIVEGVGALTGASRPLADLAVWVDYPDAQRKRRALARDGASFAGHWDEWAEQEEELIRREQPASLADVVVYGEGVEDWQRLIDPAEVFGG